MKSGSAFEALAVSVCDFSVAPCVQRPEASDAAIVSCGRLHETGVAIALRGPLPELLEVIHRGFPLKVLLYSRRGYDAVGVCGCEMDNRCPRFDSFLRLIAIVTKRL